MRSLRLSQWRKRWAFDGVRGRAVGRVASYVYFIQCGDFTKIGISKDPYSRCSHIKTSTPDRSTVELLCWMGGGREAEAEIHAILKSVRVSGEWFALTARELAWAHQVCLRWQIAANGDALRTARSYVKRSPGLNTDVLIHVHRDGTIELERIAKAFA